MAGKFKLVEAFAELTVKDSKFRATLGRVRASMAKVQARMEKVAVVARRMLIVGGAAIAGMVKVAADFEQSMARVRALTGATEAEFKKLESAARELGKTTQFSARQAAQAMAFEATPDRGSDLGRLCAQCRQSGQMVRCPRYTKFPENRSRQDRRRSRRPGG